MTEVWVPLQPAVMELDVYVACHPPISSLDQGHGTASFGLTKGTRMGKK